MGGRWDLNPRPSRWQRAKTRVIQNYQGATEGERRHEVMREGRSRWILAIGVPTVRAGCVPPRTPTSAGMIIHGVRTRRALTATLHFDVTRPAVLATAIVAAACNEDDPVVAGWRHSQRQRSSTSRRRGSQWSPCTNVGYLCFSHRQ